MKITIFNASPWGHESHTHVMAKELSIGALEAGAKIQNIALAKKDIAICDRCGVCFYQNPGKCPLHDDMKALINKFMASDIVVFATPVYMDNVTGLMKIFIDRLMPLLEPHYEKDYLGEYRRGRRFKNIPAFVVISSCAMPEQSHFQILRLFFRRLARTMYTELVGEIYRSQAGLLLLSREQLQFRYPVDQYKKLLRQAGNELAKFGSITEQTNQQLQLPLIDPDQYIEYANRMWDQVLEKHGLLHIHS